MPYRIVLTSSILAHPLNSHVIEGVVSALRSLGKSIDVVLMPPSYLLERGALDGADMLLFMGSTSDERCSIEFLPRLARQKGIVSVFWSTEDPYERDFNWRADDFDHFISNDAHSVKMDLGRENIHHLPLAGCFQQDYRPLVTMEKRGRNIFFCGAPYQNRQIFVNDLRNAENRNGSKVELHLNGKNWKESGEHASELQMTHSLLIDICSASLFTLYLHRTLDLANEKLKLVSTTPGPRLFEAALAGTVQLCEFTSYEFDQYFDPKSEIQICYSGAEAYQKALGFLERPDEWLSIAASSQYRAVSEHCYEHRMIQMFKSIKPYNMPLELYDELAENCNALTQKRLNNLLVNPTIDYYAAKTKNTNTSSAIVESRTARVD